MIIKSIWKKTGKKMKKIGRKVKKELGKLNTYDPVSEMLFGKQDEYERAHGLPHRTLYIYTGCKDCDYEKTMDSDKYGKYCKKHRNSQGNLVCPKCGGDNIVGIHLGAL